MMVMIIIIVSRRSLSSFLSYGMRSQWLKMIIIRQICGPKEGGGTQRAKDCSLLIVFSWNFHFFDERKQSFFFRSKKEPVATSFLLNSVTTTFRLFKSNKKEQNTGVTVVSIDNNDNNNNRASILF